MIEVKPLCSVCVGTPAPATDAVMTITRSPTAVDAGEDGLRTADGAVDARIVAAIGGPFRYVRSRSARSNCSR